MIEPTDESTNNRQVNISGGANIEGNVDAHEVVGPDKNVPGDEVHGDKVTGDKRMGDQTTIGDIHYSEAIAIGRGAVANNIKNFIFGEQQDVIRLRNRRVMLNRVKATWIEGLLEHSLYKEVLIELNIEHKPNAVENPWNSVIQEVGQVTRKFEPGVKIGDIFYQLNQAMLILGEPGSGKTNLLLQLARHLIAQAEENPSERIPVVLYLSSWVEKQQHIEKWLVEELEDKYYIPKKVSEGWIEKNELLLLFDGLDEVQEQHRNACVEAINKYHSQHLATFAICSRVKEFEALTKKLMVQGAIVIQTLTEQQIYNYLENIGLKLQLGKVIQQDKNLLEVADSPLMLNIIVLTYNGKSTESLVGAKTVEVYRKEIFDAYIRRMFERRSARHLYSLRQTSSWLRWLARMMIQYNMFDVNPTSMPRFWFKNKMHLMVYTLSSRTILGVIVGLPISLIIHNISGLISCVIAGLVIGFVDSQRLERKRMGTLRLLNKTELFIYIVSITIGISIIAGFVLTSLYGIAMGVLCGLLYLLIYNSIYSKRISKLNSFMVTIWYKTISPFLRFITHLILLYSGNISRNYPIFFDYCADRIFLRRVGHRYIFIHRLIMEHFASLTDEDIERIADSVEAKK